MDYKHTGGDWYLDIEKGYCDKKNYTIETVPGAKPDLEWRPIIVLADLHSYELPECEVEANGRLMANAPKLLETCSKVLDLVNPLYGDITNLVCTKKLDYSASHKLSETVDNVIKLLDVALSEALGKKSIYKES